MLISVEKATSSCFIAWCVVISFSSKSSSSLTFSGIAKPTIGSVQHTWYFFSSKKMSLGAARTFRLPWNSFPFQCNGNDVGFSRTGRNRATRRRLRTECVGLSLSFSFSFFSTSFSHALTRLTAALLSTAFNPGILSALSAMSSQGSSSESIPRSSNFSSLPGFRNSSLLHGNLPSSWQNRVEARLVGLINFFGSLRIFPLGETGMHLLLFNSSSKSLLFWSKAYKTNTSLNFEETAEILGKKISQKNRSMS